MSKYLYDALMQNRCHMIADHAGVKFVQCMITEHITNIHNYCYKNAYLNYPHVRIYW